MLCNVCKNPIPNTIYESDSSLTSLCLVYEKEKTKIRYCECCTHLQTDTIGSLETYYDQEYEILTNSEEEDQIYEVKEGKPIFRTDHQINVLLEKIEFNKESRVLDYGCAKSSMMKVLTG